MKKKVLLTGVTGFLGSHTAIQLLNKGYQVIGTLRNLDRKDEIKEVIAQHTQYIDQLHFVEADLLDSDIWNKLSKGVDYVMHIASPFPRILPKNEEELIRPAKEGTLNVLKAASENGVKRVVLTSSTGSVAYGKSGIQEKDSYTEEDWTDVQNTKDSTPYFRSKTIAEQAAWDFIKNSESSLELTVVCPGAILGPVLEKDFGTSANIVIKMLDGSTPAIPRIGFDMVDVRSVAELHVLAMENEKAGNERFIGTNGYRSFKEVSEVLRAKHPERKIPKGELPNFMVKLFSYIDPTIKPILIDLGKERKLNSSKAQQLLNWKPIPIEKAILDCASSVIDLGIVK